MRANENEKTLNTLRYLERLYLHGFSSHLIDQSLAKVVEHEGVSAKRQVKELQARLDKFEKSYQMTSRVFSDRFRQGKLGDCADFVEWASFLDMRESILERIDNLEKL